MADNRFFTNTYITGSGRRNYLAIDNLEEPLFTSFTFDIDYIASPLFYTCGSYSDGSGAAGIGSKIESALGVVWKTMSDNYDILPVYSSVKMGDDKLGFGLQQNVYMDKPLYGATEYIYMVDKRNGNNNDITTSGESGMPNIENSYNLSKPKNENYGNWAEEQKSIAEENIKNCDFNMKINKDEHKQNEKERDSKSNDLATILGISLKEDGTSYTEKEIRAKVDEKETELQNKVNECKVKLQEFEKLKEDIAKWANGELNVAQSKVTKLYNSLKCIKKIATYDDFSDGSKNKERYEELKKIDGKFVENQLIGSDNSFIIGVNKIFDELVTTSDTSTFSFKTKEDDSKSFLIGLNIRRQKIIDKFGKQLEKLGFDMSNFKNDIKVETSKEYPNYITKLKDFIPFVDECINLYTSDNKNFKVDDEKKAIREYYPSKLHYLMSFQFSNGIGFDEFKSDTIEKMKKDLEESEKKLKEFRISIYGSKKDGTPCDKDEPSENSPYGIYNKSIETVNNDAYSQAENNKSILQSDVEYYEEVLGIKKEEKEEEEKEEKEEKNKSDDSNQNKKSTQASSDKSEATTQSTVAPQTVLDMVGFISGMKKLTINYPYVIQGITGLDTAYKNHYMIKDPYLGSGDEKITLTCWESLDLRVSSMFNRYFNAVYDRQYRRERVPVNLRRFNCYVYVHDVRNFVTNMRDTYENRVLELTDMYYSVIEFRFYDCEIVPEETGNIFDNISNEAPSEMKKTNFTFTYGNCVVNFIPNSEVKAHGS